MAEVVLTKSGGMLYGVDQYSRDYIKKQPSGAMLKLKVSKPKETRRALLNRYSHAIYREAASQKQEGFESDEKAECKLRHGIPILIRDPEEGEVYTDFYKRMIGGKPYHVRLACMVDGNPYMDDDGNFIAYTPVTSLMTDEQMSKYLERILKDYARQGYSILTPKEREFINYPEAQQ